ncbi:MAG: lipase family protein [Erysipelotrichaceae bacterium]|nr:lipase family protein [Erysipelotrichaceae bacterium]
MKKSIFLLPLLVLSLSACEVPGSSSSSSSLPPASTSFPPEPTENTCLIRFDTITVLDENEKPFEIKRKVSYSDEFFNSSGKVFSKDLALASFANYASSDTKENTEAFFTSIGFDNVVHSPDYDTPETKDSVKYNFAHKKIGDYDVLSINACAIYFKPWENNVTIGKTGNGSGFQSGADKMLTAFRTYLNNYTSGKYKIWMTGHSRTAAFANIIAETLLDEANPIITDDTLFCYPFEAPAVIDVNLKKPHESIHNIINEEDIVTAFYPECYGLVRAGHDVYITNDDIDKTARAFDPRIIIAPSNTMEGMPKKKGFIDFIISSLTRPATGKPGDYGYAPDMATREHYVDNGYQENLATMFQLLFGVDMKNFIDLAKRIEELGFEAIGLIEEDAAYNLFAEILDKNGETYDKAKLRSALNGLIKVMLINCSNVILAMVYPETSSEFLRAVQNHCLEVLLPALLVYKE